jgi:hypothetical protein
MIRVELSIVKDKGREGQHGKGSQVAHVVEVMFCDPNDKEVEE